MAKIIRSAAVNDVFYIMFLCIPTGVLLVPFSQSLFCSLAPNNISFDHFNSVPIIQHPEDFAFDAFTVVVHHGLGWLLHHANNIK